MRLLCSILICLKISRMHYITDQREYPFYAVDVNILFYKFGQSYCGLTYDKTGFMGMLYIEKENTENMVGGPDLVP